jgi:L-arabonate dehydrase
VYEAGGFPLEFPVMSLGETRMRPAAMLFRNLVSMDAEESIRADLLPTIGLSWGPSLSDLAWTAGSPAPA